MNTTDKRRCCAIVGQPALHKGDAIYICGLPECNKPFTPFLPLCGSHRALAETPGAKGVRIFVDQSVAEFHL